MHSNVLSVWVHTEDTVYGTPAFQTMMALKGMCKYASEPTDVAGVRHAHRMRVRATLMHAHAHADADAHVLLLYLAT